MDHSFFDDMKQIFKALPKDKQMIATSATYSEVVLQFLEKFMRNACKIQLDLDNPALCAVDHYMIDAKKIIGKRFGANQHGGMEIDGGFDIKFICLKEVMRRVSYKQAIIFSNYQLR
jgi:superfamily II DNA/RNA helicase